jgi:hypothetical protein
MLKEATAETPRIRPIEEHPTVVGLVAEVERSKKAHFERCEDYAKTIRDRDRKYTAEKESLQTALLATQDRLVACQDRLLAIRAAAALP